MEEGHEGPTISHRHNLTYCHSGASGGPWIADFGLQSITGEANLLVGVASYRDKDKSRRYLGSSIFNDQFEDLVEEACKRPGNCANDG